MRGRRRVFSYSLETVARASGRPLNTVRDHVERGVFDPGDLLSVSGYILGKRIAERVSEVIAEVASEKGGS